MRQLSVLLPIIHLPRRRIRPLSHSNIKNKMMKRRILLLPCHRYIRNMLKQGTLEGDRHWYSLTRRDPVKTELGLIKFWTRLFHQSFQAKLNPTWSFIFHLSSLGDAGSWRGRQEGSDPGGSSLHRLRDRGGLVDQLPGAGAQGTRERLLQVHAQRQVGTKNQAGKSAMDQVAPKRA